MINDEFVEDLSNLLHKVTTSGKTQTFYDVDSKLDVQTRTRGVKPRITSAVLSMRTLC